MTSTFRWIILVCTLCSLFYWILLAMHTGHFFVVSLFCCNFSREIMAIARLIAIIFQRTYCTVDILMEGTLRLPRPWGGMVFLSLHILFSPSYGYHYWSGPFTFLLKSGYILKVSKQWRKVLVINISNNFNKNLYAPILDSWTKATRNRRYH